MITIPTGDLTGILADVIPLASPDEQDLTLNRVAVEWDGDQLHAHATDQVRCGISTWDPTDKPSNDSQDSLFTDWGSGDEPWTAYIDLDDAKDLVKVFKLGPKEGQVPLTVDYDISVGIPGRLKVARHRDTGHSAMTAVLETSLEPFPDLRVLLAKFDAAEPVRTLALTAKYVADFAKVRPRGPLELTFTGATSLVHVAIGERFVGAIQPVRREES